MLQDKSKSGVGKLNCQQQRSVLNRTAMVSGFQACSRVLNFLAIGHYVQNQHSYNISSAHGFLSNGVIVSLLHVI